MSTRAQSRALRRRRHSISGERSTTLLTKIDGWKPKCELEAQTSLGKQPTFKVVGNQGILARPQPDQQRLSMDTADIGFKTQEASDGLTMSGLIPTLGRAHFVFDPWTAFMS
jgi:hypothetical protein